MSQSIGKKCKHVKMFSLFLSLKILQVEFDDVFVTKNIMKHVFKSEMRKELKIMKKAKTKTRKNERKKKIGKYHNMDHV